MTITSYFGTKPCCDCGRTGNYTIIKNGYRFTVCRKRGKELRQRLYS